MKPRTSRRAARWAGGTLGRGTARAETAAIRTVAFATIASTVLAVQGATLPLSAQESTWPTPLTDTCLYDDGDFRPVSETSIAGLVRDASDGVPVPGARVDAEWTDGDGDDVEAEAWTDPDGRFRFCRIPEGTEVQLSPEVGGGPGLPLRVDAGRTVDVELTVPLPSPDEPSGLLGTIQEHGSGAPVHGATVRLRALSRTTLSGEDGSFVFERVEPGSYALEIRHLSYGTVTDTVHLVAGRPLEMEFDIEPEPIQLAAVQATARPRSWIRYRADLVRRMRQGTGDYVTRAEIERRDEPPLHELLDAVPGVTSGWVRYAGREVYYPYVGGCGTPEVFVDGARISIDPTSGIGIDDFRSAEIELIEVYRRSNAPVRYSTGDGARCGVILIWTLTPG